jgi:hypothetical protein
MADEAAPSPRGVPADPEAALRRIAVVALLAIALGFAMQGLILVTKLTAGGAVPAAAFVVDLAQTVTWSFFVCTGIGVGASIAKARPTIIGLLGLICAPLAVALAKASQKIVASMIGAADKPAVLALSTISVARAIEYGVLGWLLGKLAERDEARWRPYLAAGAAVGIVFGGAIAALSYYASVTNGTAPGAPQVAELIVKELLFPVGCASVIFASRFVGRTLAAIEARG